MYMRNELRDSGMSQPSHLLPELAAVEEHRSRFGSLAAMLAARAG